MVRERAGVRERTGKVRERAEMVRERAGRPRAYGEGPRTRGLTDFSRRMALVDEFAGRIWHMVWVEAARLPRMRRWCRAKAFARGFARGLALRVVARRGDAPKRDCEGAKSGVLELSCMEDFATLSTASAVFGGGFESIWMALAQSERAEEAEAAHASSHDYHPELATPELIVQIRRLLATGRRIGRLVCRYLADLADRIHGQRDRELLAYVDEFHAAACFFDLGPREVRERVRIGRALRQLPQIEAAFIAGELSYSRVREVTRVAQPDTESGWLDCARHLDMRALERRVAGTAEELAARQNRWDHFDGVRAESRGATDGPSQTLDAACTPFDEARGETWSAHRPLETSGAGARFDERSTECRGAADGASETCDAARAHAPSRAWASGAPDERSSRGAPREQRRLQTRWLDHDSLRVTFELPAEAWALLERALEGARRKAATPLSDAEALAAVGRDALASQNQAADASDPRCSVVVYECRSCAKSELDTGIGLFELEPAIAATLGCGARVVDLAGEGREVQRGGPLPAAIRRAVLLRDRCRCRVPGCSRRRYVDVHHLVPRSEGGEHSRRNCITLCSTHHRRLHEGNLLITGDADAKPVFQDAANQTVASFGEPGDMPTSQRREHTSDGGSALSPLRRGPRASNGGCVPATSRRERHAADGEGAAPHRPRRGHASGGEGAAPASPRERQPDEHDVHDDTATHLGTSNPAGPARPERQSDEPNNGIGVGATHLGMLNENALRLLQIMGRRGNWSSDVLLDKSALPHSEFQHALLLLELDGRVRRRGCEFDPV
jgi:hypothetical protein